MPYMTSRCWVQIGPAQPREDPFSWTAGRLFLILFQHMYRVHGEREGISLRDREEEKSGMPMDLKALSQGRVSPGALP